MKMIRPVVFFAVAGFAWCALPPGRLVAQDVTVGEPQWFSPEPAPEVMPAAEAEKAVAPEAAK